MDIRLANQRFGLLVCAVMSALCAGAGFAEGLQKPVAAFPIPEIPDPRMQMPHMPKPQPPMATPNRQGHIPIPRPQMPERPVMPMHPARADNREIPRRARTPEGPPAARVLPFMDTSAMGLLSTRDWSAQRPGKWEKLGVAQGEIAIAKGKEAKLAFTPRVEADFAELGKLLKLGGIQALELAGTDFSGDNLDVLKDLTSLRELILRNANFGDDGLETLKTLTGLRELTMNAGNVSQAGLDDLAQALPLCRILLRKTTNLTDADADENERKRYHAPHRPPK